MTWVWENVINRLFDQNAGYWRANRDGMDTLSDGELGAVFSYYLGLSDGAMADILDRMSANGDYELAAKVSGWYLAHSPESPAVRASARVVFQQLREKFQELNPFKFIIYSEAIGQETAPPTQP